MEAEKLSAFSQTDYECEPPECKWRKQHRLETRPNLDSAVVGYMDANSNNT